MKITVIGGKGRWGSCLAEILANNGHEVVVIDACHSPDTRTCRDTDVVIIAVPGRNFKEACEMWLKDLSPKTAVINASKTILAKNGKLLLPHQIIKPFAPSTFVTLACGGFPRDIRKGHSADATVFGENHGDMIKRLFSNTPIEIGEYSFDWIGGELGSALKNIAAIASGLCYGLGYPVMMRSKIITKIGHEIVQIATKHGANPETFALGRSCFLTDLIGTCYSDDSKNFKAGMAIARGLKANSAEGIWTLQILNEVGELNHMPLSRKIYNIAFSDIEPSEFMKIFA
ncbi:hypothetical protein A2V71_01230 [Candidatus Berkelbacteria bacterium RBG_13_40_8]|uniref:Glycerol-3-phosphate dehydrogenase n=1 Tax=Candidatus Berkelbacteria bacterium RBG_13_40_8 TaxID=1797467 RepID=A0A1F5DMS3_9BACT|nr:MAG: hypothetical protein A2V71_01230 [Candidatus Berkelbacteria bacterium RBG_13_40_8]